MKTEFAYINFVKVADKPKTVVYECRNNQSLEVIGTVRWYGRWRQYCFMPESMTVFNVGCLEDIRDFIKQLPRKTSRKKD